MRLSEYFERQPKGVLLALSTLFVILCGMINRLMGASVSLLLFYIMPLFLTTWFVGRWAGLLIVLAYAFVRLTYDFSGSIPVRYLLLHYWNIAMELGFFLFTIYALSRLKRSVEREKTLARTDDLTRTVNRRSFFDLANRELQRAHRFKHPITIAYIDLDNFKIVNDRYGHRAGDSCLRLAAATIMRNVRSYDIIARLGGDEFVVLFPETGYDSGQVVITRIKRDIVDVMRRAGLQLTVSIGAVTCADTLPSAIDEIVKNADDLMYYVKSTGKNTIRHAMWKDPGKAAAPHA